MDRWLKSGLLLICLLLPTAGWAAASSMMPAFAVTGGQGNNTYSLNIQVLLAMTLLTVLPSLLLTMTAFTRIVIVLGILRQAIGLPQAPNNQIILGLSLFVTFFVMAPTFDQINTVAIQPYMKNELDVAKAIDKAQVPIRKFMLAQTRTNDLNFFKQLSKQEPTTKVEDLPFFVLMPAFLTSELKTAFQMGFLLFLPFLIIDLVVASVLMAMGMMMLSPLIVSLPFKIMLFVLVDGWTLILGSLASSFVV